MMVCSFCGEEDCSEAGQIPSMIFGYVEVGDTSKCKNGGKALTFFHDYEVCNAHCMDKVYSIIEKEIEEYDRLEYDEYVSILALRSILKKLGKHETQT